MQQGTAVAPCAPAILAHQLHHCSSQACGRVTASSGADDVGAGAVFVRVWPQRLAGFATHARTVPRCGTSSRVRYARPHPFAALRALRCGFRAAPDVEPDAPGHLRRARIPALTGGSHETPHRKPHHTTTPTVHRAARRADGDGYRHRKAHRALLVTDGRGFGPGSGRCSSAPPSLAASIFVPLRLGALACAPLIALQIRLCGSTPRRLAGHRARLLPSRASPAPG